MNGDSEFKKVIGKRKGSKVLKLRKKKKVAKNEIVSDNLMDINDIESSQHLFNLQIKELLKELKLENDIFDNWLNSFIEFVSKIPETSSCEIKEFSIGNNIKIPINQELPENGKGCFKFIPPTKILPIGSYFLDTMSRTVPVVDIAIEIPKACWQGNDNLNYRYHRKRAFYLSYIAMSLRNSNLTSSRKFDYQNECDIKPNLIIVPKGIPNISICVTAYPCETVFKESRFHSDKNNIRAAWLYNNPEAVDEPTPFYNSTVWVDSLLPKLNDYLKENISSESVKEAIILLKVWSSQRELTVGYGRLSGFIITSFVVSLLKNKRISAQMTCYEIFKCALLDLSTELLTGVFFKEFTEFDTLYFVSKETLLRVQHEAKLALTILDMVSTDGFSYLFIKKIDFMTKFEYLIHLKNVKLNILPEMIEKLRVGLGNRILLIDVAKESICPWSLKLFPPKLDENFVTIGILLNPDVSLSNIEKGPLANDPKAKEFREFWGKQSELRRFQDGSIREAVFWPASTLSDKRAIFRTMLKDILERHFNISRDEIIINGIETECVLKIPDVILSKEFPAYGTGEEAHIKLMQSFNFLSKQLRTLKLPLLVASVQGISSSFRFTEVFPPLSVTHDIDHSKVFIDGPITKIKHKNSGAPPYVPALKAIVHFEGSGKWPDDIEALKRVKAAFQIKIAELAKSQLNLMAVPFVNYTDIFKDGYIFRLEVACHKEIYLMKQIKAPDGSIKIKESKESQLLEASTEILPKLNSVIYGLQQQYNSFGPSSRLAKRWIASQLKHGFVQDITIDLLMAYIHVHPEPFTCPCTPQIAFVRFLSLLITHDWAANPLIVNLNNEFKADDIESINTMFTSQRTTLPPMVIVTPFDKKGNMWTKSMPPEVILKRIILLAEASLGALCNVMVKLECLEIKNIFRPPLDSFDVIIHLKRNEIPKLSNAIDLKKNDPLPKYSPYKYKANELYPVVEYDPIDKFLEELKINFGDWAVFLNDPYGGDLIAVKWKSAAFKSENAKTYHGVKIPPNVNEIIESFQILGGGLIKEIQLKTENWQLP